MSARSTRTCVLPSRRLQPPMKAGWRSPPCPCITAAGSSPRPFPGAWPERRARPWSRRSAASRRIAASLTRAIRAAAGGPALVGPGCRSTPIGFACSESTFWAAAAPARVRGLGTAFRSVGLPRPGRIAARGLDHLGIARLHAIAGASYGGMVGARASRRAFAERVGHVARDRRRARTHPLSTAWRAVQRESCAMRSVIGDGARRPGTRTRARDDDLPQPGQNSKRAFALRRNGSTSSSSSRSRRYLFARGADYAAPVSTRVLPVPLGVNRPARRRCRSHRRP